MNTKPGRLSCREACLRLSLSSLCSSPRPSSSNKRKRRRSRSWRLRSYNSIRDCHRPWTPIASGTAWSATGREDPRSPRRECSARFWSHNSLQTASKRRHCQDLAYTCPQISRFRAPTVCSHRLILASQAHKCGTSSSQRSRRSNTERIATVCWLQYF